MSKHRLDAYDGQQDNLLAAMAVLAEMYADNAARHHSIVEPTVATAHLAVAFRDAVRARCSMSHTDAGAHLLRQLATGFGHMADDIERQPLS